MIEIIDEKITNDRLLEFLVQPFPEMIKFVVDLDRQLIGLGGEFHADAEAILLDQGSKQEDLWGGNLYIDKQGKRRIEFSAMINIRPSAGNRSMLVEDERIQERMNQIIETLLP
jgi:hypothetical protein